MFPRRRQMFFIGSILFFGSLWFMMTQLDMPSADQSSSFDTIGHHAEVHNLQSKLLLVEKELKYNKQAMEEVRKSMETLIKMGNVHDSQQRKELEDLLKVSDNTFKALPVPKLHVAVNNSVNIGDTCQALPYQVTHSDINMINVYEKLPFDDPDGGVWKQGYPIDTSDSEWVGKKLKVFVVPHSHNDPGWIKTVDKYFQDQTQHILNNVVDALSQDSSRRFIWAEMSYLSMWWGIATPERKTKMKELIDNGQLEIVTAGWVMNDEANTHYFAMIDQMIEGNEWLSRTLGVIPKSGWAIDPFGHSSTMAYILKKMNFENMLIQRVHYAIKKYLSLQSSLEFRWRQAWASDESTDIPCHMMPFYSYDVPHTCGPDPKICCQFDFARLPGTKLNCPWKIPPVAINDGNVAQRSAMLLDQYRKKSKLFKSNTLLVILGDDFRYNLMSEAQAQYDNYARIFAFVNSHPELNAELQFGTLSEYFNAMKAEIGGSEHLPSLTGDFFTYADREDHYWSGYYVSRPYHKMQERVLESHLRGAEILFSLALPVAKAAGIPSSFAGVVFPLLVQGRKNLGLFQHHDGITGTAKDHVMVDYGNQMMKSVTDAKRATLLSAEVLLLHDLTKFNANNLVFDFDEIYNVQNQPPTAQVIKIPDSDAARVVIYNSLAYERTGVVRMLVSCPKVAVAQVLSDGRTQIVAAQTNLVWSDGVNSNPDRFELLFMSTVPATGLTTYVISSVSSNSDGPSSCSEVRIYNAAQSQISGPETRGPFQVIPSSADSTVISLENEHMTALFNANNGFLQAITSKLSGSGTKVAIDFTTYTSRTSKDKSGAYLFLPAGPAQPHVSDDVRPLVRVIRGLVQSEVQVILPNLVHRVSLYTGDGRGTQPLGVHVCNDVDVRSGYDNKEIAMRLTSEVKSGSDFYTDLNGFQIQHRTTYEKLPLQANFYPMPSMAYLQDSRTRLSLLTAQPLGVSSLKEGQLEVILDRRLMQDDNRGVGQGVKDNVLTPESFVILLEHWEKDGSDKSSTHLSYPSLAAHQLLWEMLNPNRVLPLRDTSETGALQLRADYQPLSGRPWPCDMHLLNLRSIHAQDRELPTDETALLLHRVGHECTLDSDKQFISTCTRNDVTDFAVTSLYASSEVRSTSLSLQHNGAALNSASTVSVKPMEIEAFRLRLT